MLANSRRLRPGDFNQATLSFRQFCGLALHGLHIAANIYIQAPLQIGVEPCRLTRRFDMTRSARQRQDVSIKAVKAAADESVSGSTLFSLTRPPNDGYRRAGWPRGVPWVESV